jgi:hypothetical protein
MRTISGRCLRSEQLVSVVTDESGQHRMMHLRLRHEPPSESLEEEARRTSGLRYGEDEKRHLVSAREMNLRVVGDEHEQDFAFTGATLLQLASACPGTGADTGSARRVSLAV